VSCHDERGLFATQLLSPSFQRFGSSVRLMQIENADCNITENLPNHNFGVEFGDNAFSENCYII